jgi:hypothetical protein
MLRKLMQVVLFGVVAVAIPSIALAASSAPSDDCCCPLCCPGQ